MGKVTGFMEFERVEETYEAPVKRIHHYKEFVAALSDADAKVQGARCMDCGIPFCNNGCPVNNIIPDFNDLVYQGDWKNAIEVLHSTNNFPEFTGRICPAPCEAACTLGINKLPVGIKSIEHAIIDKAWANDWVSRNHLKQRLARKLPWLDLALPGWQLHNSWRGLATMSPYMKKMTGWVAYFAMASLTSKWRSG